MEWMQSKKSCYKAALPGGFGHAEEDEKEEYRIGQMEKQTCPVVTPGVIAEELMISHQGKPGERMPEPGFDAGKSVPQALSGQPLPHMGIFREYTSSSNLMNS